MFETEKKALKERINAAFRLMRKRGLFARQNYWCCRGCASCAADREIKERQAKGKTIVGCVYTTQQDCEDWKGLDERLENARGLREAIAYLKAGKGTSWEETRCVPYHVRRHLRSDLNVLRQHLEWERTPVHYIGFCGVDQPDGTSTETVDVGKVVVECLKKAGVETAWNGDPGQRIGIPLFQDMNLAEAHQLAQQMQEAS